MFVEEKMNLAIRKKERGDKEIGTEGEGAKERRRERERERGRGERVRVRR
jgi:hypothetical protein